MPRRNRSPVHRLDQLHEQPRAPRSRSTHSAAGAPRNACSEDRLGLAGARHRRRRRAAARTRRGTRHADRLRHDGAQPLPRLARRDDEREPVAVAALVDAVAGAVAGLGGIERRARGRPRRRAGTPRSAAASRRRGGSSPPAGPGRCVGPGVEPGEDADRRRPTRPSCRSGSTWRRADRCPSPPTAALEPGERLHERVVARGLRPRPGRAEAAGVAVHGGRVARGRRWPRRCRAARTRRPGSCAARRRPTRCSALDDRARLGRTEVEGEAALAALARGDRVGRGAHRLALGRLDLDHVGTEVGQHLRAERARPRRRRSRATRSPSSSRTVDRPARRRSPALDGAGLPAGSGDERSTSGATAIGAPTTGRRWPPSAARPRGRSRRGAGRTAPRRGRGPARTPRRPRAAARSRRLAAAAAKNAAPPDRPLVEHTVHLVGVVALGAGLVAQHLEQLGVHALAAEPHLDAARRRRSGTGSWGTSSRAPSSSRPRLGARSERPIMQPRVASMPS